VQAAGFARRLSLALQAQWWRSRPSLAMRLLQPLSWLYDALAAWAEHRQRPVQTLGVPVIVVGNLVVGGAGKTPTVIALIDQLRMQGWTPGVVSRGYGRTGDGLVEVAAGSPATLTGDEPLLIHRRTGARVMVGRDRVAAARALLRAHPEVDLLLSDDGLGQRRLPRDVELMVFDGRGAGNGLTLPAGPLRRPLPAALSPRMLVLYNADAASTPLPGLTARRSLAPPVPLAAWWAGDRSAALPWSAFGGRRLLAAAGLGEPERFFKMLEAEGLSIDRLALPDHASYATLPWPPGTRETLVTEKDAAKLPADTVGTSQVWVVALDFQLPPALMQELQRRLPPPSSPRAAP
jgi:tetraacyldisaccharide 4'-kinase